MKNFISFMFNKIHLVGTFMCLIWSYSTFAQTPGMIVEPATGAAAAVLDPNGDGYVSATTAGFFGNDQTNNELPWQTLIPFGTEPPGDVQNGPNCGFTDFVESATGSVDPVFHLSTSAHWLFRFRMAGIKPNAKSYSILVDIDNTIGSSSAAYTAGVNPGFELEIVLATKFGVQVYDHRLPCGSNLVYSYSPNRIQKSIAATTICSSLNYFLEFYVDWADITAQFGVTAATPMRYAIVSNMAAKKSTICNPNSASDIGGVDDATCGNLEACFTQVINQQPACAPNSSNPCVFSDCPTISGLPLAIGATSVSGTSTEADGTTIRVYVNDVLAGTTTVNSGTWTVSPITALVAEDQVTATAQATGEVESGTNCNNVTIAGAVCTPPLTTAGECGNNRKSIEGTGPVGAIVRVYLADGTLLTPTGGNLWTGTDVSVAADGTFIWRCTGVGQSTSCNPQGGPCLADGNYYATAQLPGQCESSPVWFCVNLNNTTSVPQITSAIDTATTSVSGTLTGNDAVNNGVNVYLYINDVQIATTTTTNNLGAWTITVPSGTFNPCDEVYVVAARNVATPRCPSQSTTIQVSGGVTAAPVVLGPYCGTTTTVNGTSTESNGTTIQVFSNSVLVGTTTVTGGVWTATGLNIPAGASITARATNTVGCKSQSAVSAPVVVGTQNTNVATIDPSAAPFAPDIVESDMSISGTGTPGDLITLYLDSWPMYRDFDEDFPATAIVNGSGIWTVSLIDEVIYAGGILTAASSNASTCQSAFSAPMNVVCLPPDQSLTVSPDNTAVCSDSIVANIEVSNSQIGVIYQLFNNNLGANTGSSILGNAGTIVLSTFPLTADAEISITAIKAPFDGSCTTSLFETVDVTVNNNPNLALSTQAQNPFICGYTSTNIQVLNSEIGFEYQLRNNADNSLIGTAVNGTGGTINLPTGPIATTTTFNVLATSLLPPTFCSGQLSNTVTVTVDEITLADAGPNQTGAATCGLTTVTLAANAVSGSETGSWSIVSGTGGSFVNANNPSTNFSGVAGEAYVLKWTISNGSCSTESDVAVDLNTIPTAPTLGTIVQASCASNNGEIQIASPLGPQFEYSIDGSSYQASPVFNSVGSGSYDVTVRNATSLCTSLATTINIDFFCPYPDAAVASINTTISGDVSTNDQVAAGTTYGTSPAANPSNPAGGTLTMDPSGNGEYTFSATAPGVYVYEVEVCAPAQSSPCPTETLSITVLDPQANNNAPVVFPDFAVTEENQAVVFNTLANDASVNEGAILNPASVTVLTTIPAAVGATTVNTTTGEITFTPASGFVGTYSYEYEVCDNSSPTPFCGTSTQVVTVLPTGSNVAIIAADNNNQTIQGQTLSVSNTADGVLANVSSTGTGTLTASVDPAYATQAGVGTLTMNANGTYTFVPDVNFVGTAVFPYEVCEGTVCVQATLNIVVEESDEVTYSDVHVTSTTGTITGDVSTNDQVAAGTTYGTSPTANPSNPSGATLTMDSNGNGEYTFSATTPGVYVYDIEVCTPTQNSPCLTETLTITVLGATTSNLNTPVTAPDFAVLVGDDVAPSSITVNILGNDFAGNNSSTLGLPTLVTTPSASQGTAIVDVDGNVEFTPAAGFYGTVEFTYEVCESPSNECRTETIIITVIHPNDPDQIVAGDDYNFMPLDTPLAITDPARGVLANDYTTVNPSSLTASLVGGNTTSSPGETELTIANVGTITMQADGTYSFVPDLGYEGTTAFQYTACEGVSCVQATLYLMVGSDASFQLPIELLYIKAYGVDDKFITVEWATATELNNQGFEIQRSVNGVDFRTLGWQDGVGTSTMTNTYSFDDHEAVKDVIYYYRLKQVDLDGTITYTNIVSARIEGENENSLTVYPNPNTKNNMFGVDLMSSEETTAQLYVYDLHGKVFYTQPLNLKIGNNVYLVPSNNLESGQYMIVVRAAHVVLTEKVVVID